MDLCHLFFRVLLSFRFPVMFTLAVVGHVILGFLQVEKCAIF